MAAVGASGSESKTREEVVMVARVEEGLGSEMSESTGIELEGAVGEEEGEGLGSEETEGTGAGLAEEEGAVPAGRAGEGAPQARSRVGKSLRVAGLPTTPFTRASVKRVSPFAWRRLSSRPTSGQCHGS